MNGSRLLLDSNVVIRLAKYDNTIINLIIAGSALVKNCKLVTANIDDFKNILELKLIEI